MKHQHCEHLGKASAYLLEDLGKAERQAFEAHLSSCPQCQSEQESYARTLDLLHSVEDEPIPRHFFVQQQERTLNPWDIFRMLRLSWQAVTVAVAGLFVLAIAGGIYGFTQRSADLAELKREFLRAAEEQNRRAEEVFLKEVRAEIARTGTVLTKQQDAAIAAAIERVESRTTDRVQRAETRTRDDAQKMAFNVYQALSQQRAQDLGLINLRFDGIETKSAIETRQTDVILNTLLQVAELKLR